MNIACLIRLYLESDTLALYLEMTEEEQCDADVIELRLKEAFTEGPFIAYAKLCGVVW